MLNVIKREVGSLSSNCYIISDDNNEALIIDPGDDADYIQRIIADEELKPVRILATHGHFDHVLAVMELKLAYNIPFLMSKDDEFLLERMQSSANHFTGANDIAPTPKIDSYLTRSVPVKVGNRKFKVIKTPGHTPGSVSLYCKKEKILFVGDLIFAGGGIGRYDYEYCSKDDLIKSIKTILKIPDDTVIYPGHGDLTSIGNEKGFLTEIIGNL
jgi:glyoxylase-like metal-dependent hydrolase (beta-lactamase superfamily II)